MIWARKNSALVGSLILLIATMSACGLIEARAPAPEHWPTEAWRTAPPEDHGFDPSQLEQAGEIAGDIPFLDGLLVIRDGYIVYEAYFNGYSRDTLHNMASVAKSWTSAGVGVARSQGELMDLQAPLSSLMPAYFDNGAHDDKADITLQQLLMMRSGIEFDDNTFVMGGYGGEELLQGDVIAFALDFPMAYEPGATWNYSSLDSQLISGIVEQAMGESLESVISKNLFSPMGISHYEWLEDGTGTTIGEGELSLTPRDLAKLGLLYLHGGQWNGQQLVPRNWVELSTTPQGEPAYFPPTDQQEVIDWYGYHWWTWGPEWFHGHRSFQAQGYGGQQVLVIPDLELIIVTTAQREGLPPEGAEEQESQIYSLLHDHVLPAVDDIQSGE